MECFITSLSHFRQIFEIIRWSVRTANANNKEDDHHHYNHEQWR